MIGEELAVNFIGHVETLTDDICKLHGELGIKEFIAEEGLPHCNSQKRGAYRDYYTNERSRELIYQIYKKDIDYFRYEF